MPGHDPRTCVARAAGQATSRSTSRSARAFPTASSRTPPSRSRTASRRALAPLGWSARRGFEIDDDVRDREVEALARVLDDVPLEPVRAALRVRRDDELVRARRCAAHPRSPAADRRRRPLRGRSIPAARMAASEASSRSAAAARAPVLVRDPVPQRRVQRGRDDEHLGLPPRPPGASARRGARRRQPSRSRSRAPAARRRGARTAPA